MAIARLARLRGAAGRPAAVAAHRSAYRHCRRHCKRGSEAANSCRSEMSCGVYVPERSTMFGAR